MSKDWSFEQDADARWRWRVVDAVNGTTESVDSFPTQIDCVLDAVRFIVRQRRGEACLSRNDE